MPRQNDLIYFQDVLDSIARIEEYIKGLNFNDFADDRKTIDAVVRNLEIIGEAAKNISAKTREENDNMPWEGMIGMRNKVIHEYSGVDLKILWKTIQDDLPELKIKIKRIKK